MRRFLADWYDVSSAEILGKTLGKWLYEIRKGMHNATAEIENEMYEIKKKQENDTGNFLTEDMEHIF